MDRGFLPIITITKRIAMAMVVVLNILANNRLWILFSNLQIRRLELFYPQILLLLAFLWYLNNQNLSHQQAPLAIKTQKQSEIIHVPQDCLSSTSFLDLISPKQIAKTAISLVVLSFLRDYLIKAKINLNNSSRNSSSNLADLKIIERHIFLDMEDQNYSNPKLHQVLP